MPSADEIKRLQRAKEKLGVTYREHSWFRGVGIVPADDGGLMLRLNVEPSAKDDAEVPTELDGIAIEVVYIGEYEAR